MSLDLSQRDQLLSTRILESMRDGVVSIDLKGDIITFNKAAGRILGKNPADVLGRSFAEEFLAEESFDDFNEVVFKAIYEAETTHSIEIALAVNGERTDLLVASSFLTLDDRDGEAQRFGVVVVFSDTTEERKRRKIKRLFGEYVDPRIVETIIARGEAQASRRGTMTISFVDMRDFTGWSERLPADTLIELLNGFLAAMTRPIGAAGGITDKYIGDAVMACWGPPFTVDGNQAADACTAALGQIEALGPLRADLAAVPGIEQLDAVVGVATGDVLSGDIGPPSARNFTVIGNAVNLAARLQEAAKVYGVPVIISEETRERAGDGFVTRELDRITVRGSHVPVSIFALLGRTGEVADGVLEGAAHYEAALAAMRGQEWGAAERGFRAALERLPGDKAVRLMLSRLGSYTLHPPPDGWDGVWRGPAITISADEPVPGSADEPVPG